MESIFMFNFPHFPQKKVLNLQNSKPFRGMGGPFPRSFLLRKFFDAQLTFNLRIQPASDLNAVRIIAIYDLYKNLTGFHCSR